MLNQKLLTPLDKVVASNDKDFFLRGKMEIERPTGPYGHILHDDGKWTTQLSKGDGHGPVK